ncbi:hypothetical protein ACLESO_35650 [Pyxidicoccus sp. 3LG]
MYYRLRSTPVLEGIYDVWEPDLGGAFSWVSGQPITTPLPNPIEVKLDDSYGTRLPDLFDTTITLMSDTLVAALRRAGVTNIDTYPAVLVDEKRNLRIPGYQAVQVLGRIKAADPEKSVVYDPTGVGRNIVSFDKLVISEAAARGQLMFRLLESATTLIVHERVKAEVDKASLRFVSVHPTDDPPTPLDLHEL